MLNSRTTHDRDRLDLDLLRQIDAIYRRFEADWHAGKTPAIGDYLGDVAEEGRTVLRTELEALAGELPAGRRADEPGGRPARDGRRGADRRAGDFTHVADPGHGETFSGRGDHRGGRRSGHG